jgi:hypothetical protein
MLALKSLVAVCAFTLLIHPAMAANDASGNAGNGANAATCARPKLTPEQRAERRALREQRLAQGIQPPQRTAEQKARAAARRASLCSNYQSR